MSMFPKTVCGAAILLIANQAFAQNTPAPSVPPPAAPSVQQPVAQQQYPQQPRVQQPVAQQQYPQQPGVQQPVAQQQYPQQPGVQQPGAQQQYPQQPGVQQPGAPQQYPQQPGVQQPGAPQQYPQQPGAPQQNIQLQPGQAAPAPAAEKEPEIRTFSFVPRLGFQLGGSGTQEVTCSGNGCGTNTGNSTDYDLKSAAALSVDFLFKIGTLFRIGPGLLYTHTMDVKPDLPGVAAQEMGSITNLDAVMELVPKVGNSVWLVPRLQTGLSIFNASGIMADGETADKLDCQTSAGSGVSVSGCDSIESPHVGFNIGAGFGVMFAAGSSLRIRIDSLIEYYSIGLEEVTVSGGGITGTVENSLSGTRYLFLAGLEI